jgi:FAD/FMN-containing dehydrogenase
VAEVVVSPRDADDVRRIAAASAATGVPLTPRGGGTGNYGQAVPLHGGAVIDMTALDRVVEIVDGTVRVQAGMTIFALEEALRWHGFELRMFPSTWRTATIGGFISGGTGGIGSVTWGGLREPGNLLEATLVTVEEQPRTIRLTGGDCNLINRTFGTTGLLTEVRLPVQPAVDWCEFLVAFDSFEQAIAFGQAWTLAQGIQKRLCSVSDSRLAAFFEPFHAAIPKGCAVVGLITAPSGVIPTREMIAHHQGHVVLEQPSRTGEASGSSVHDIAFNHATLQVLKQDRSFTYLQSLYVSAEILHGLRHTLHDEVMWHVEFLAFEGKQAMNGLPVIRYSGEDRLNRIIEIHEQNGAPVANPHVFTVEDGSRYKRLAGDQLGFKHRVDPKGLLNPGKMRTFVPAGATE